MHPPTGTEQAAPWVASPHGSPFSLALLLDLKTGTTLYATYHGFLCRKLPDLGLATAFGGPSPSLVLRTLS